MTIMKLLSQLIFWGKFIVTEMVAITENKKQPISLFSHIHSSTEKEYQSTNTVTYQGIDKVISALNRKATFVFDRGYDMNELFMMLATNKPILGKEDVDDISYGY